MMDMNELPTAMANNNNIYLFYLCPAVPRKLLIDRFESTPEPDEPLPFDDNELDQEEELYDEDQFYKESDISPGPAPKLQSDLSKKPQQRSDNDPLYTPTVSSSISPPQHARDDSPLEGEFLLYLFFFLWMWKGALSVLSLCKLRFLFCLASFPAMDSHFN